MELTEEEKLRLKILKIKLRKGFHRTIKKGIRFSKKAGLILGLTLVSLCSKAPTKISAKNIFDIVSANVKDNAELLKMIEGHAQRDIITQNAIQREISNQINTLAEEFVSIRSDSLSASIDRLKNKRSRNSEIRRNFRDAVGISQISSYCLATQCAADYRALKAMGLEQIIPDDLKQNSALCVSYINNDNVKSFVHKVPNTDKAIKEFIQKNKMSGGALIMYPRDKYNYHAVSLDMPDNGFEYNDSIYQILTSSANKERKSVPISTSSFRSLAPGRKAVIIDKLDFFVAMLEKHLNGKSLAEQTALLYQGGADEFIAHISEAVNLGKKQTLAEIEDVVNKSYINMPKDKRSKEGLYLLAMVPLVHTRKTAQNMYLLDEIEKELNQFSTLDDKCAYIDKTLNKALVGMPKEEQKQFIDSLIQSSKGTPVMEQNTAVFAAYKFWQMLDERSDQDNKEPWHEVANDKNKKTLQPKDGKQPLVKIPYKRHNSRSDT